MPRKVSRRTFLAVAGAAPWIRQVASSSPAPLEADVVVVGGDPAAYAAVYRLARHPGLRVALMVDDVPWATARAAVPASVAVAPPFVRGHQVCFDTWRDLGNPGWGYMDVLPSFKRLETYEAGEGEYRGGSGPLPVAHCWDPHPLHRACLLASVSGGFQQDSRHDFNGPRSQSVAGYYQKRIKDDQPYSLADLLLPAGGAASPTLSILRAPVARVVIERGRAVGVAYGASGRETIRATRAVLLCSEPVRAAQLLMLSGIGPADHLRAIGVAVAADRRGVGGNLHDQLRVPLRWQAIGPALTLSESSVTAGMFTVSLNASPPDLQMDYVDPRAAGGPRLGIDITLVQPASRGDVRLRTTSPADAPAVSLNALSTPADVIALVQGVRLARLIGTSPQLDRMRGDETAETAGVAVTAQAELEALVRRLAAPTGHVAGTCAMGRAADAAAVVDATLAVHGVAGLQVAGAAIMPTVVNAPPEAASLMIGDRAADLLMGARSGG